MKGFNYYKPGDTFSDEELKLFTWDMITEKHKRIIITLQKQMITHWHPIDDIVTPGTLESNFLFHLHGIMHEPPETWESKEWLEQENFACKK